jgi:hypothetical protein
MERIMNDREVVSAFKAIATQENAQSDHPIYLSSRLAVDFLEVIRAHPEGSKENFNTLFGSSFKEPRVTADLVYLTSQALKRTGLIPG